MRVQTSRRLGGLLASLALAAAGCASSASDPAGPSLAIAVAPLNLQGVTDAVYEVRVVNGDGQEVWHRTLSSTGFGDGSGSLSYVGTCDAAASPNKVELVLSDLVTPGGSLVAGVDYINPAPAGAPLVKAVDCVADQDAAVTFDITFARAAQQGFFDVAVTLDDLFCSAKLDCQDEAGDPLLLLHDSTGARSDTAVMAFACTGGDGSDTHLYLSDVDLTCGVLPSRLIDAFLGRQCDGHRGGDCGPPPPRC